MKKQTKEDIYSFLALFIILATTGINAHARSNESYFEQQRQQEFQDRNRRQFERFEAKARENQRQHEQRQKQHESSWKRHNREQEQRWNQW